MRGHIASGLKIIQAVILPKILLLGLLLLGLAIGLLMPYPLLWQIPLVLLLVMSTSLIISVPVYLWKRVSIRDFLFIPVLLLSFVKALLNIRKAFKRFMHTPHTGSPDAQTP